MNPKPNLKDRDPRANAFEFKGGPEAALLVHGFTGTCAEMLPVGELISKEFGWEILCPLLPGHGTTIEDLDRTKWTDWIGTIENAYQTLSKDFKRVHLVGLSMGSLLCLELFRRHPASFQSLVLMVPAVWLKTPFQRVASTIVRFPLISSIVPPVAKSTPNMEDHVAYDFYPARATGEFSKVFARAQTLTKMSAPPTFICYSAADEVVHPKSATFLAERLINPLTRIVRLEHSTHVVTIGSEKERLFSEILSFYRDIAPKEAGRASAKDLNRTTSNSI